MAYRQLPDPYFLDFKQSDEYAEEYEEDQRVRELLKGKMEPWYKKLGWRRIRRALIFFSSFIIPASLTTAMITDPPKDPTSLGTKVLMVVMGTIISYIIILVLLQTPRVLKVVWEILVDYYVWAFKEEGGVDE